MIWPILILVGVGVWYFTREGGVSRPSWLWVLAAGLLLLGFGGFGRHGGGMMGMGMRGGMMGRPGMMGGQGMMGGPGMMGGQGMMGGFAQAGWHFWAGVAVHALLIIGAIVVAVIAWRRTRSAEPAEVGILRMRLAKGEITPEEYDLLRQKLQG